MKQHTTSGHHIVSQQSHTPFCSISLQTPREELLNGATHAIGFLLSTVGGSLLAAKAWQAGGFPRFAGFAVFGISLVALYGVSTIYHCSPMNSRFKRFMQIADHLCVFLLIAGTYTPITLFALNGFIGWALFSLAWGGTIIGSVLKVFMVGRFEILSTGIYVALGWMAAFAAKPLMATLAAPHFALLFAGGICYTVGAVVFLLDRIPYNHSAWHLFVIAGSVCHYIALFGLA